MIEPDGERQDAGRLYGMREAVIYLIRTETVRKTDCSLLAERMPLRFEKARRYYFERDRLLCLGAGILMAEALGLRDEQEIRYSANGKPYLPGGPAFNLSHSGTACILARGEGKEIGADIEEINEKHIDLAPEVYTGSELEWMREEPVKRFFRLWTWKESVMKATGLGMSLAPRSFEVLPFAEGKPVRILGREWYAKEDFLEDSAVSVCAEEPIERLRWIEPGPR